MDGNRDCELTKRETITINVGKLADLATMLDEFDSGHRPASPSRTVSSDSNTAQPESAPADPRAAAAVQSTINVAIPEVESNPCVEPAFSESCKFVVVSVPYVSFP